MGNGNSLVKKNRKENSFNDLYDLKQLFSLGGASTGIWLLTSTIAHVLNLDSDNIKWLGLLFSFFLAYLAIRYKEKKMNIYVGTLAFFNGLLIYVTASGIDSINHGVRTKQKDTVEVADTLKVNKSSLIPYFENTVWFEPVELKEELNSTKKQLIVKSAELEHVKSELLKQQKAFNDLNMKLNNSYDKCDSLKNLLEKKEVLAFAKNKKSVLYQSNNKPVKMQNQEKKELDSKILISKINGLYGVTKGKDNILVEYKYDTIFEYKVNSKLFYVVQRNKKWGALDSNFEKYIPCKKDKYKYIMNAIIVLEKYNRINNRSRI